MEQPVEPQTSAPRRWVERTSAATTHAPWILIALGSVLRVLWPSDMEWKLDEKWMFAKALRIASGADPWPWIGMPSGAGIENPGLSLWPFAIFARVLHDPVAMAQAVQVVNVLALWGFALWVGRTWPTADRSLGLWGVALFAVSPLPILFARKLWAQDLLPMLVLPWLWSHSRRERSVFAFAWGLTGAWLGQLHMSGFFTAAALAAATWLFDRKRFPWRGWLAGSVCGALTLLPWLQFALFGPEHSVQAWRLTLRFFLDAGITAWGLGLRYTLGDDFFVLLTGPVVAGVTTYAAGLAQVGLVALALFAAVTLVRQRKQLTLSEPLRLYATAIVLCGLTMSAARVHVYAHYLIAWSPLLHVAAVWTLIRRRWALLALCGCQLVLSVSFALFIHQHGGAPAADYGVAYSRQTAEQRRLSE